MRLYVIGGEGQVARSLREAASLHANIAFGFGARPDVDLLHPGSIETAIAKFRPDVVINPAAYTAVDKAESEPEQAYSINRDGAREVANAARVQGAPGTELAATRADLRGTLHGPLQLQCRQGHDGLDVPSR